METEVKENTKLHVDLGCFGCLLEMITIILFCMAFSVFFGSGEFYNKCIKGYRHIIHGDTIEVRK